MLSSLNHGRCDEHCSSSNGGGGGFLKVAMASPPPPHCFFLASSSSQMMLSFSSGLGSGSSDASMQGVLARVKGPFTPNQWMELEHQALIYKHIVANAPVPPTLLLSIRRSLHPSVFQSFSSGGTLGSSSFGWGSFHLGYTGSADPEPGRCRRTDGKKWRCSRDAVVDQKYCERHINRGRHRSRKHVEGRSSHVAKAMPAIAQPALGASAGLSGSHAMVQHPTKSLAVNVADPCPTRIDRMLLDKGNAIDHAPKVITLSEETSPRIDYTAVTTDSLMNTARTENLNLVPLLMLNERPQPNPIHHFFNKDMQSDGIHLSISVPTDKPNFLSNSYDQADISLGVGSSSNDGNNARASWIPASWETSIGGPLGEFFTDTSNASDDKIKNCPSPALNLLTDGRATSDQLHSPTGVLQMTNINSVSSSTVSSPGSLCNSLLAASLVNPQTVQTL